MQFSIAGAKVLLFLELTSVFCSFFSCECNFFLFSRRKRSFLGIIKADFGVQGEMVGGGFVAHPGAIGGEDVRG